MVLMGENVIRNKKKKNTIEESDEKKERAMS